MEKISYAAATFSNQYDQFMKALLKSKSMGNIQRYVHAYWTDMRQSDDFCLTYSFLFHHSQYVCILMSILLG